MVQQQHSHVKSKMTFCILTEEYFKTSKMRQSRLRITIATVDSITEKLSAVTSR